ncbi:hypothetical protein [Natronoglycomyces albus]|uniref:Uncharacterized protein n=1 Tax=Natronoglycomyces albus TaxID=2811108 RepID=A0A895XNW8_9ACTN|nr:hypothetical protein [Natronoglycomyces albus]QSB05462.1 hypothetical protein JQS30_00510 [Natronoglycomyces albus]
MKNRIFRTATLVGTFAAGALLVASAPASAGESDQHDKDFPKGKDWDVAQYEPTLADVQGMVDDVTTDQIIVDDVLAAVTSEDLDATSSLPILAGLYALEDALGAFETQSPVTSDDVDAADVSDVVEENFWIPIPEPIHSITDAEVNSGIVDVPNTTPGSPMTDDADPMAGDPVYHLLQLLDRLQPTP